MLNCQLEGSDIYSICNVEMLPFEEESKNGENPESKLIKENVDLIKSLLSFGFYFSFDYDLSLNLEKIQEGVKESEKKFWWNYFLLKDVRAQNVSKKWQIVLIQVVFFLNFYIIVKRVLSKTLRYI